MGNTIIVSRTTKFAFKEEATFNTAPTDAAANSLLTNGICTPRGLGINWVANDGIVGHLGHLRPHNAGYKDDLGFDCQLQVKGSGTAGVAPDIGDLLECSFGKETLGVASTVSASPTPTTVSATVAGGTIGVGQLADIEYATDTYQPARILTNATNALTWWPPVPAAPATGADVIPGVSYLLTSTPSEMKSGTGFWYFENGEKKYITGCRGNVKFAWKLKQPILADFALNGCGVGPTDTQTPIGYTWLPPYLSVMPPVVMGITLKVYIPAKVKTGSSTTSVLLKTTDGLTSYFWATDAVANPSNPDRLIVDVGASVWETKDIATWTYSTQTATCTALTGAPAADQNAYIEKRLCLPEAITFDPGHTVTRYDCATSTYGWAGSQITAREATVEWGDYFKSFMPLWCQEQAMFTELWCYAGTTRGNKIVMCCPNVFNDEYTLDLGGDFGTYSTKGQALGSANGATANTEMYLTFL